MIFGVIGSIQQERYQSIQHDATPGVSIRWGKLFIVALILIAAIITNYAFELPAIGVWVAILTGAIFMKTPWGELKKAWQGTVFLLALILCASLMPVEELPKASWVSTFILGFISAVFDNIPLTKLCLEQGGYDWGILAFSVGFGGSMIWFGSSAGVALSNEFPEARSVVRYIRYGWHIILAYIIGFFAILWIAGWHPRTRHRKSTNSVERTERIVVPLSSSSSYLCPGFDNQYGF
jgi:Na+/H+ antiporter NhaD/arsenite permease-like protein